jgi:hypothetical protein
MPYTPPALTAVDFALSPFAVEVLVGADSTLTSYTVPSLTAVDFVLTAFAMEDFPSVDFELESSPGGYFGILKCWTGAAWVAKTLKVWSGAAWAAKPLKRWDGSSWKLVQTS